MLLEMAYLFQGMSPEFMSELDGCLIRETRHLDRIRNKIGHLPRVRTSGRVKIDAVVVAGDCQRVNDDRDDFSSSALTTERAGGTME